MSVLVCKSYPTISCIGRQRTKNKSTKLNVKLWKKQESRKVFDEIVIDLFADVRNILIARMFHYKFAHQLDRSECCTVGFIFHQFQIFVQSLLDVRTQIFPNRKLLGCSTVLWTIVITSPLNIWSSDCDEYSSLVSVELPFRLLSYVVSPTIFVR